MNSYNNNEKVVPIYLDTIEAFPFDNMVNDHFKFLEKLVAKGYTLTIHRDTRKEVLQTITDVSHIRNFITHYKKAIGVK